MKRLRDLLIEGALLAVPVVLFVLIAVQAVQLVARISAPLAARFPENTVAGVAVSELLLVATLLLCLLALGVFRRSMLGRWWDRKIEGLVLRKVPGFMLLKSIASGVTGKVEGDQQVAPVFVELDDQMVLGFLVEESASEHDLCTVFVPSAPTIAAGAVMLVDSHRVRRVDVPLGTAMASVTGLGLGTQALLRRVPVRQRVQEQPARD
ncbi:MAG: DUF502 domain-containing protein [Rhizobacter sp.]|nr:DUF502 domain-containing protein [Rhizobacter sp.]